MHKYFSATLFLFIVYSSSVFAQSMDPLFSKVEPKNHINRIVPSAAPRTGVYIEPSAFEKFEEQYSNKNTFVQEGKIPTNPFQTVKPNINSQLPNQTAPANNSQMPQEVLDVQQTTIQSDPRKVITVEASASQPTNQNSLNSPNLMPNKTLNLPAPRKETEGPKFKFTLSQLPYYYKSKLDPLTLGAANSFFAVEQCNPQQLPMMAQKITQRFWDLAQVQQEDPPFYQVLKMYSEEKIALNVKTLRTLYGSTPCEQLSLVFEQAKNNGFFAP